MIKHNCFIQRWITVISILTVAAANRSLMNVPFQMSDPSLDSKFLAEAQAQGLVS